MKVSTVETFSFAVMAGWAQHALAREGEVGRIHQPVIVKDRHRKDLPDFGWIELRDPSLENQLQRNGPCPRFQKRRLTAIWAPSAVASIWRRTLEGF